MRQASLILATALLSAPAAALVGDAQGSLERARALFAKVDGNGDGLVSAVEAGRNRIPSKEFVLYDADRDRRLSRSEFTLFYRQLLVKAGEDVGDDLDAEAARIEAGRRAEKAEQAKRIEAARQKALEDARRAEEAREAAKAEEASARTQAAREAQQRRDAAREGTQQAEQGAGEVAPPPPVQDDEEARIARARAEKQALDAARAEAARLEKQRVDAARAQAARLQKKQQDAARTEAARLEKQRQDALRAEQERTERARREALDQQRFAKGTPAERRAAGYVKRLVDGGRLSAEQARVFYDVLVAPPQGSPGASGADEIRAAHGAARKRISSLIRSGALSSEEGRQLAAALDARAKAALPAEPAEAPRQGRGVGTARSGEGVRRVGPVKDAGTRRAKKETTEKGAPVRQPARGSADRGSADRDGSSRQGSARRGG